MSYWMIVALGLGAAAAVLPAAGAVTTVLGDVQILYALALIALLARLVVLAVRSARNDRQ